jgi:hypothetical protein
MGYASARYLPYLDNYAEAVKKYEDTKPIRGSDNRRPLGRRRDHHTYWLRMVGGNVELVLHQTPVITYLPDSTVVLTNGTWVTNSTHEFISAVLRGVRASGWRGNTKLEVAGQMQFMPSKGEVVLVPGETSAFKFQATKPVMGYCMNRKAANNVRRRYAGFRAYFENFIKLRSELVIQTKYGSLRTSGNAAIAVYKEEVDAVLGGFADGVAVLSLSQLGSTATTNSWNRDKVLKYRPAQEALLLKLIDPTQSEEARHANYYKATLALLLGDKVDREHSALDTPLICHVETALNKFDCVLMMACAREVLKIVELTANKTPNPAYLGWIIEGESK